MFEPFSIVMFIWLVFACFCVFTADNIDHRKHLLPLFRTFLTGCLIVICSGNSIEDGPFSDTCLSILNSKYLILTYAQLKTLP
jgi:hypothetical protein